jgi:hypothetical protein
VKEISEQRWFKHAINGASRRIISAISLPPSPKYTPASQALSFKIFDRTVYGNNKNSGARIWRWLQELKEDSERDIRTEMV